MRNPFDRREFLKTTAGALSLLLSREGLGAAQTTAPPPPAGPPLRFGIVGLGAWGREIVDTLGRTDAAQVTGICDVYEPFLKRGSSAAPKAAAVTDWRRLLDAPEIDAIVVATPTPLHREIAVAALQARKHVYCEAPIAASTEDAKAIATAAEAAKDVVFQAGLQGRTNPLYLHVLQFVKTGVLGDIVGVHAQWNRKDSWRRAAPSQERERALNWRLERSSPGLMGEVGIHYIDLMSQYLGLPATAVSGAGAVTTWRDGREVPDTASCVLQFGKVRGDIDATLASSFGGCYTVFQGSNSSLLLKENRGWLIKEADSPLLGWEVYARKESVHDETGIAMVADATKLLQAGKEPGKDGPLEPEKPVLLVALESFITSVRAATRSACGPSDAYAATAAALTANTAVLTNARIELSTSALRATADKESNHA